MKKYGKTSKILGALGTSALIAAAVTGCGQSSSGNKGNSSDNQQIKLTFWTLQLGTFKPYIDNVIKQFESEHPNVQVNWVDVPGNAIQEKYQAAFAAGNAPDLANLDYGDFSSMLNEFAPLDNDLTKDQTSQFPSAAISPYYVNNKLYAIPYYDAGTGLPGIYNMKLLKKAGITKPPTTIDEMFADGAKLHKVDPNVYWKLGGAQSVDKGTSGSAALQSFNVPVYSSDFKKAAFNTADAVTIWNKYKQAWKDGVFDPDSVGNANEAQLFLQGAIAMYGGGLDSQLQKTWGPMKNDLQVGGPVFGSWKHYAVGPTFFWVVSKQSKHPKLATELAMDFLTVKNQLAFHNATKGDVGPVTKQAINDKDFYKFADNQPIAQAYAKAQADSMQYGVYVPNPLPGDVQNKVTQAIQKQFDAVLLNNKDTKQALQQAASDVNQILSQYWSSKG